MKRIDLFCSSPASTAICASMDQRSMVRQSSRTIDRRYNSRRSKVFTPCSSEPLPTNPKPYHHQSGRKSSSNKPTELISPSGSSRYLLTNTSFFDMLSNFDPVSALVPIEPTGPQSVKPNTTPALKPSSTRSSNQVVVLRVSLHCKGCEGKVRKHISRMEGVTSFSIDFATKKVTVIGDVTPSGVLASVSRVKNAQFWPSSVSVGSTYRNNGTNF